MDDLEATVSAARRRLLLCSPYVSSSALTTAEQVLPDSVKHIDIWTKLSSEDWLVGASQPEAILEFVDSVISKGRTVHMRASRMLHAKMVLSDGPVGIAGSSNLTRGGFCSNIEIVRVVDGVELEQLQEFAETVRPKLEAVDLEIFRDFVGLCLSKTDSQEAMLDLIRTELPPSEIGPAELIPYKEYLDRLDPSTKKLDQEIVKIAKNLDGNNNSGKVKHAFYGIQRFLQEYPQHIHFIASLPEDEWFEVQESRINQDWRTFLRDYESEESSGYMYSMRTLVVTYLTPASGGKRTGGGGGDNELKRVWPSVGRLMARARRGRP